MGKIIERLLAKIDSLEPLRPDGAHDNQPLHAVQDPPKEKK